MFDPDKVTQISQPFCSTFPFMSETVKVIVGDESGLIRKKKKKRKVEV
jgi:hypothetical protein